MRPALGFPARLVFAPAAFLLLVAAALARRSSLVYSLQAAAAPFEARNPPLSSFLPDLPR